MDKIKVLFVCHGNICRSAMAEFVMKDMVKKAGVEDRFEIASAATSTEEIGNGVYPPVKKLLAEHAISCEGKRARQITSKDAEYYDYLIGMDSANIRNMSRVFGKNGEGKIFKLMEIAGKERDVADPWYTRDFEATWRDVNEGCEALLGKIMTLWGRG